MDQPGASRTNAPPSPHRPDVLLFDLGGVLVENVGFDRLNALLPAPLPVEELKTRWLTSTAVRAFETGACSVDRFAATLVEEWEIAVAPHEFIAAFASWPKGFYPGADELLSRLRKRYTLACLSNSNPIHWERFAGFHEHFDIRLSSHLLGEVKPDKACFERALQECQARPSQVAFFDDSLVNVTSARTLGIRAFHVNGLEELGVALDAEGWL